MLEPVFHHDDYKKYLLQRIESEAGGGRGIRKRLAEAVGCQVAYISHVLAGDRHFSMEQAESAARFFHLRRDEAEFFLVLVEHNRAGTPSLRKFLERQLQDRRDAYQNLLARVPSQNKISAADQSVYYSSWHYQAVRVCLSLPRCRQPASIAKELKIPLERVTEVLSFLLKRSLVREEEGKYFSTAARIHLPNDAPEVTKLHSNWRIHALRSLDSLKPQDLHYSGVVSLSQEDFSKVQEIFRGAIVSGLEVVKRSPEERLAVINVDVYEL